MKKAYTYIFIGSLFTLLSINITIGNFTIDILHDSIGFLLIVLGVIYGEKERPIQEFIQAKYLGIALGIYSLVQPFLFSTEMLTTSSIGILLTLLASLTNMYMYYSLFKAEYIWNPSPKTRQFVNTYVTLAIITFVASCFMYMMPLFAFIVLIGGFAQSIYLLYALYQLRK